MLCMLFHWLKDLRDVGLNNNNSLLLSSEQCEGCLDVLYISPSLSCVSFQCLWGLRDVGLCNNPIRLCIIQYAILRSMRCWGMLRDVEGCWGMLRDVKVHYYYHVCCSVASTSTEVASPPAPGSVILMASDGSPMICKASLSWPESELKSFWVSHSFT